MSGTSIGSKPEMPSYLRLSAAFTRAIESGSDAGSATRRQRAIARVDRHLRVRDHFLVPAGAGAANRPDERVVAIDDDPDDRPVGGSAWHCGLDLDLLGFVEQGEIVGGESHRRSVAHLAAR